MPGIAPESPRYSAVKVAIGIIERLLKATAGDRKLTVLRDEAAQFIASETDPVMRQRRTALRHALRHGTGFSTVILEAIQSMEPEQLKRVIKTDPQLGPLVAEYLRVTQRTTTPKRRVPRASAEATP